MRVDAASFKQWTFSTRRDQATIVLARSVVCRPAERGLTDGAIPAQHPGETRDGDDVDAKTVH